MDRILIIGDVHLQKNRQHRGKKLLSEIARVIREEQVKTVVFLGDMFHYHDKAYASCYKLYDAFLREVSDQRVNIVQLVGNHEMSNSVEFMAEEHVLLPYKGRPGLTIVDRPMILTVLAPNDGEDRYFTAMPYLPPGSFQLGLNMLPKPSRVIMAHQEFSGADFGHGMISKSTDLVPDGHKVISGHIHKAYKDDKLWYVGTPMHTDFGDSGDKFVHIIQLLEHDYVCLKSIKLDVPEFINVHVNCSELLGSSDIDIIEKISGEHDYAVTVTGTKAECLAFRVTGLYEKIQEKATVKFKPTVEITAGLSTDKNESYQVLLEKYANENGIGETYASVFG